MRMHLFRDGKAGTRYPFIHSTNAQLSVCYVSSTVLKNKGIAVNKIDKKSPALISNKTIYTFTL